MIVLRENLQGKTEKLHDTEYMYKKRYICNKKELYRLNISRKGLK